PFRDKFRSMVDDPNGLDKLDYDKVVAGWDEWRDSFLKKWSDDAELKREIGDLLDGPEQFTEKLEQLPNGVDLKTFKLPKDPPNSFLRYNAEDKRLETNLHLLPNERDSLLAMGKKPAGDAEGGASAKGAKANAAALKQWRDAVNNLYKTTGKLSLK